MISLLKSVMRNKIIKTLFLFVALVVIPGPSFAQTKPTEAFFTVEQMPNMVKFLPPPPAFHSPFFVGDSIRYEWGKAMRNCPERAKIAWNDAYYGLGIVAQEFSEPFGLQISEKGTPRIYKMLKVALATCDSVCKIPKKYYMRKRPFVYFVEPTLVPEDEEDLRNNGSYPSGHTILGWSSALLLAEINPEAQDTLLARGYMYGESRIIAGYHWASDVEAGRLAASAAYARLHTSKRFLKMMARARREFVRLKKRKSNGKA